MQLRQLDLNLLKAFDALIDERNVTKAAERLAVTQPAVSATLNRLRDALDDPLFVRSQRGITPTPRALALKAPIKKILADIEAALQPDTFEPASADFTVTVSATDYALRAVVLPLLARLRQQAPGVRMAVVQARVDGLLDLMERGQLDLALITPDMAPPDLHSRTLFEEHYVCVMRSGHSAASEAALTLDQFCALDHAIVSLDGGGFRGATDEALAAMGRQRRVVASVPSFGMLLDLVRDTDLVAAVPRRLLRDTPGLTVLTPPLAVAGFTKVMAWHARTHTDPRQRWVREQLVAVCEGLPLQAVCTAR
ncbi:LysR family transcriptional regulator [Curvibacter sp. HBC61]|uniref:LysR family transcriptional regulator n=1 Tax=Curvibacter cyanobacteriorum TaxID=3026422 RepID=A0ABT5MUF3_9BURK|nr:LysR family transcriptional regulator [Curvibacter sp. HBC61]MDD0837101.1 LysR family transcriptional regulator [Curvibacter sp. HBC61]